MGTSLVVTALAVSAPWCIGVPTAQAKNGDTHITAVGSCWGVDRVPA